jgi:polysaccharide export outer membrane protein
VNHHNSRANSGVEYGGLMGLLKGKNSKPRNMRALRAAPVHPRARQFGGYNMGRYGPQAAQTPGRYYKAKPSQTIRPVTPPIFQQWVEFEPDYLIQPDDQLDIVVSSAPELSRTLTVGPDGRIVMPMSQPIMAAGRSFVQVQALLKAELSKQLRDPTVAVTPRAYAPQQIFVGGEVGQPGTYTIPGRIGALEAIFMAGGMRPTARTTQVAVLRRAPNGGMMMRSVDIRGGLKDIRGYSDNMQLKRGDIIYVPQSTLAEVGTFMQNFRNALPVDFNLSYQFGAQNGGTTVVSP